MHKFLDQVRLLEEPRVTSGDVVPEAAWRELERQNLLNALERANWKISGKGGAAELLQIKPWTLESRMKAFAIEKR